MFLVITHINFKDHQIFTVSMHYFNYSAIIRPSGKCVAIPAPQIAEQYKGRSEQADRPLRTCAMYQFNHTIPRFAGCCEVGTHSQNTWAPTSPIAVNKTSENSGANTNSNSITEAGVLC